MHELCHVIVAELMKRRFTISPSPPSVSFGIIILRAIFGRHCIIDISASSPPFVPEVIANSGWIFSWFLALMSHYLYIQARHHSYGRHHPQSGIMSLKKEPIIVVAAYMTAIEATTTDLLGWVPLAYRYFGQYLSIPVDNISIDGNYKCIFFCGNFGVILINSSWINIDGGKKALDMLEKMVNVTMMRGELCYE